MLGTAHANDSNGQPPPSIVDVGVYLNDVRDIDLRLGRFHADLWVWFRWTDEKMKPYESFEVIRGQKQVLAGPFHEKFARENAAEVFYSAIRIAVDVSQQFDVRKFPLDNHLLVLSFEDSDHEAHELQYQADTENTRVDPEIQISGWNIAAMNTTSAEHEYQTNYGDITLPSNNKALYSRFNFEIDLKRPGWLYFFKLFWTLFVATSISFLSLFVRPVFLDARFGLCVGSLFAAVASCYVIAAALPEVNQVTLTDRLSMISVGFIFLTLVESIISLHWTTHGQDVRAKRLDAMSVALFVSAYITLCIIAVSW